MLVYTTQIVGRSYKELHTMTPINSLEQLKPGDVIVHQGTVDIWYYVVQRLDVPWIAAETIYSTDPDCLMCHCVINFCSFDRHRWFRL